MLSDRCSRRRIADEGGFTMIELLVVIVAGMVVAGALFTILDVTLRQTMRTFSRVDATQRARTALESIEQEMHSACVANQVRPILTSSTDSSVSFYSQYGNAVNVTPAKHTVTFDSASSKLTDSTYVSNGGITPNWTYPATPTTTETVLTNVAQSGTTPVFQYFSADPTAPSPLPTPLSDANSLRTTEVRITLVVKAAGGQNENPNLAPDTVTNSVLLRLTPIPNAGTANADDSPCQ